jgi:hypothetical protein
MPPPKFLLADKNASPQLKTAYKAAVQQKSVTDAVSRVLTLIHTLIDEAGFRHEMQNAVQFAVSTGVGIVDILRDRESDVCEQIEMARAERHSYENSCKARNVEVQAVINACASEILSLSEEIKALDSLIDGLKRNQAKAVEKYKGAGLSDAEIEVIGIKPSYADVEEWKLQIKEKLARKHQLVRFLKSSPDYDLSILEITEGTQNESAQSL